MQDKQLKTKVFRPIFDNELDIIELSRENIIDEAIFFFGENQRLLFGKS